MYLPSPRFRSLAASCVLGCLAIAAARSAAQVPDRETPRPAQADEAVEAPPGVEVIHVRGRASGIETDMPASVTSFDPATIQALGAKDISDLSRVTPNVTIVQPGATQATFFVRGIGLSDFSSNAAGAVSIFQDDVAINAPAIQTPQLFDLEGVDIVRGPQGTGHFRNASAGAIRVRSRRPSGGYSAQLRATLGRYQPEAGLGAHRAAIQDYEGALEFPLAEGLLSSRFAFRLRDAEPYQTNGCGNAPPISQRPTLLDAVNSGIPVGDDDAIDAFVNVCGERGRYLGTGRADDRSTLPAGLPSRVGDAHNWAARGILRLAPPGSEWDVQANAHGSRLDQQATFGQVIGTQFLRLGTNQNLVGGFGGQTNSIGSLLYQEPDNFEEYRGLDGNTGLCQRGGSGRCKNPIAQLQLAENLSRRRPLDLRPYRGDFDRVGFARRDHYGAVVSAEGRIADYDLDAIASYDAYERASDEDLDFTPDELITQMSKDEAWQSYDEIRVAGELDRLLFGWELGGYYLYEQLDAEIFNEILDGNFDIFRNFEQEIHSRALWGSFEWDFLDDLTLEGGVRWNYERKEFDYFRLINRDELGSVQSESWSEPTGELILTWHIEERVDVYARYTRGFKAGHFNSVATHRLETLLARPETNDAWEVGLRAAASPGWLGASFFYYRYTDFQVFLFSDVAQQPPTLEIVNAHEAELYGVEIEGQLRPLRGVAPRFLEQLMISANASWLQGQYIDFQNEQTFQQGGGFSTVTFDFSGNDLANAPQYKVSGAVEWTFDLGRFGALIPRYDVSWTDDQFFDPREGRGSSTLRGAAGLPKLTVAQPALWLHGMRLSYRTPSANVEIAGWARNLTDEVYKTFVFDASRFAGAVLNFTGEPRTIGIDLVVTF